MSLPSTVLNHVHQPAYVIGNSEMRKGMKTDKPGADKRRGGKRHSDNTLLGKISIEMGQTAFKTSLFFNFTTLIVNKINRCK